MNSFLLMLKNKIHIPIPAQVSQKCGDETQFVGRLAIATLGSIKKIKGFETLYEVK
jgi:hypothetical protein